MTSEKKDGPSKDQNEAQKENSKSKQESKKNEQQKSESSQVKDQVQEYKELLQRTQADFENYKKHVDKQRSEMIKRAAASIIEQTLPVLDSFELALKNTTNHEEFVKGVELIFSQLFSMLEQQGLKKIDTKDQSFDPYKHEVLLQDESDKEPGAILEELQKGYTLNDLVLRTAKVKISKGKKAQPSNNNE